jgi:hypothetical protein
VAGPSEATAFASAGSIAALRHPGIGWQLSVLDQLNEERALRCRWVV